MAEQLVQSGMVRFVLVGLRENFSGYLGGGGVSRHRFGFAKGVCTLPFQEAEHARKRLKFHAAFPEGSKELEVAQAAWNKDPRNPHGNSETPTVHSEVRPSGEKSGSRSADDRPRSDETQAGSTGVVSDRNGLQRSPETIDSIREAFKAFDHSKDDHWTQEGKPKIQFIRKLTGDDTIMREDLDALEFVRKN
jgi:hypothetical protein